MKFFHFNPNLITLKCVIFLFFGALGSLIPFLPLHMNAIGLSRDESVVVSVVAPLIAILGPAIACPLADRLAGGFGGAPRSRTGLYLRVMIAVCLALATAFYWLLLAIPPIIRSPPNVTFMCDPNGGAILQDRCGAERTCYNWNGRHGSVLVKKCFFTCNVTADYPEELVIRDEIENNTNNGDFDDDYYYDLGKVQNEAVAPIERPKPKTTGLVEYPHMCYHNSSDQEICEVYTQYSRPINFLLSLKPNNNTDLEDRCFYQFAEPFSCKISQEMMRNLSNDYEGCQPMIKCEIHDPYNNTDSLLLRSQCGYDNISYWLYLVIRSIADIFPAAAVALLATSIVIATRETSTGRSDIGKQLASGALGFAIFAPIIGGAAEGKFLPAMISFTVLMVLAIIILLVDSKMPLSPPEWWWHTRCGLLALPMSSVRKYGLETAALGLVLFLLGIFWNAIDAFLPWHVVKLPEGNPLIIGLTITIAAIPAILYLIFAERFVDYCGHSNILIGCFASYIIHHIALIITDYASLLLLCELLEIFTLHMMYVTAVMYLRHLVPRKLTACAQALPIIAHFCLGRCIGALIGGLAYSEYPDNFENVHKWFAVAAAIVGFTYFLSYHFYLKPKCGAATQLPPTPAPSVVQSMNGNGSYTPLRVYHNGKSKKGHFRY